MEHTYLHDWPQSKTDAIELQKEMAEKIQIFSNNKSIKNIAAVETAYNSNNEIVIAAVSTFSFPDIIEQERTFQYCKVTFPYIPGLFFFREGEAIIKALEKLNTDPDLIIVHGHGIAHPRFCGIASHIGLLFDKPTIGCCRKLLVGTHREVRPEKGDYQEMIYKGKHVGYAIRSKDNVKPIFVSPGHLCDLNTARDIIMKNLRGYRLPEPLRLAHSAVNKYKRHVEMKFENYENQN